MQTFSFHESSVTGFIFSNNRVVIDLEDVLYDESKVRVRVQVEGVVKILIDSAPSDIVTMATSDGEVLSCDTGSSKLSILIEWNDFSKGDSFTHSYDISGEKVKVAVI